MSKFSFLLLALVPGACQGAFTHSVASFDPGHYDVILWTRYDAAGILTWQVATDMAFTQEVATGTVTAAAASDYTVMVQATGLQPYTMYYYRFRDASMTYSDVGETKTLPAPGNTSSVKIAATSCSDYMGGFFNVYKAMADMADIDVVLHLGDYIYEDGNTGSSFTAWTIANNRNHSPDSQVVSLAEYRERYRQYRTDAHLQLLHRKKPMIWAWDDHEIATDAWMTGAVNHDPATQGTYADRLANARQAAREYVPTKTTPEIYRDFDFGGIVHLFMLDTRIQGRVMQVNPQAYFTQSGFDFTGFRTALGDSSRTLLGTTQRTWLQQGLTQSTATWQVLGSQVLMGDLTMDAESWVYFAQYLAAEAAGANTTGLELDLAASVTSYLVLLAKYQLKQANPAIVLTAAEEARLALGSLPVNVDSWGGYEYAREQVFSYAMNKNFLVMAGDSHNAWHHHMRDASGNAIGHEFGSASVSAPSRFDDVFSGDLGAQFVGAIPNISAETQWVGLFKRGFVTVTFTEAQAHAQVHFVDHRVQQFANFVDYSYIVEAMSTTTTTLPPTTGSSTTMTGFPDVSTGAAGLCASWALPVLALMLGRWYLF